MGKNAVGAGTESTTLMWEGLERRVRKKGAGVHAGDPGGGSDRVAGPEKVGTQSDSGCECWLSQRLRQAASAVDEFRDDHGAAPTGSGTEETLQEAQRSPPTPGRV